MLSRLMKNKKLAELVEAQKVDDSVITAIKENEKAYDNTKKKIKKLTADIEEINKKVESKKHQRSELKLYNFKEHKNIFNEISSLKNEIKKKQAEIDALEDICMHHENMGSALKDEIEKQHFVYLENEIYVKAIEKIESRGIDLPATFYKKYLKYVNTYINSEFSIKYGTKIVEPDVRDLVFIAGVLKKNEELHGIKENDSKEVAQESKNDANIVKTTNKVTAPKKVVEELTSNKVVKIKKKNEEKSNVKLADREARKKEVVNQ